MTLAQLQTALRREYAAGGQRRTRAIAIAAQVQKQLQAQAAAHARAVTPPPVPKRPPQPTPLDIAGALAKQAGVPSVLVDLAQGKIDPTQVLQSAIANPNVLASALPAAATVAPFAIAAGAIAIPLAALAFGKSEAELLHEAEIAGAAALQNLRPGQYTTVETIANPRQLRGIVSAA